jgi:dTDP-4-dehydrorhamnose reductase
VLQSKVDVSGRLLIVGGDGVLGNALDCHRRLQGGQTGSTTRRAGSSSPSTLFFDLEASPDSWPQWPDCDAAVLCASVTSLEKCRRDPAHTRHINVHQTVELAGALAQRGIFVVFLSTNLVFDGSTPLRHVDETTSPMTEYGRQKAETESLLSDRLGSRCAIVRLTKVFHSKLTLVQGWLRELGLGQAIKPFEDMVCAPISLSTTVSAIETIAKNKLAGIWHLSAKADVSYAELARMVAKARGFDPALVCPVSWRDRCDAEHNPKHTTLDVSKTMETLGYHPEGPVEVVERAFTQ